MDKNAQQISLPFEIEPVPAERIPHLVARGHLDLTENGVHLVYHRYTALLEMEQHESFLVEWHEIQQVSLKMSLFSAQLILNFRQLDRLSGLFGLQNTLLKLKVHHRYRDQARAAADRLQRELSRITS